MTTTYQLPTAEKKADYVQDKFDEIAVKYDRFNDWITFGMHRYWKRFMVHQTGVAADGDVLDVCCGTGDIALRMEKAVPQGKVHALDFSAGMLEIAKQRGAGHSQCDWLQGDAMQTPFPSGKFNAITMGYGLRNVTDLQGCLKEMFRVLKPGGVFVSLDVGKVKLPIIKTLSQWFFFFIVPRIGKLLMPGQDMFDYLPHSSIDYPSQERIRDLMLESGFEHVTIHNFCFGASTIHVARRGNS